MARFSGRKVTISELLPAIIFFVRVVLGGTMAYQDVDKRIRECKKCGEIKSFAEFTLNKACDYGISWDCKKCTASRLKKYHASKNPKSEKKILDEKNNSSGIRKCRCCGETKPLKMFKKEKKCSMGYAWICHTCSNRKSKQYKKAKYLKKYEKQILLENQGKKKCSKCGLVSDYSDFQTDKACVNGVRRVCKKCFNETQSEYRKNNIEKYRINHRMRIKTDPNFKLSHTLRTYIVKQIKNNKGVKSIKSTDLLGCSIVECRKYLELQFQKGMTWENHGRYGWHIDHIRPCASFDLTNPKQQKECFHYTNLQPLWAFDNLSKGAKYDEN